MIDDEILKNLRTQLYNIRLEMQLNLKNETNYKELKIKLEEIRKQMAERMIELSKESQEERKR